MKYTFLDGNTSYKAYLNINGRYYGEVCSDIQGARAALVVLRKRNLKEKEEEKKKKAEKKEEREKEWEEFLEWKKNNPNLL